LFSGKVQQLHLPRGQPLVECLPPPQQQQQQQRGQVQCPVRPSVTPAMVIPMTSNRRKKGNYFFS